jgi:hypothetical protein
MTRRLRSAVLPLSLLATSLLPLACGPKDSTPAVCGELAAYTPTTTTPLSFATDVYPIMASTSPAGGCAQENACHGLSPLFINQLQSKTLQFLYNPESPAMAKAGLMMASINAPSMQRVMPSNVAQSLLSYKISGKDGLACISSMCSAHASVGTPPCGDPMPSVGTIAASDRSKILDWIATGAAN